MTRIPLLSTLTKDTSEHEHLEFELCCAMGVSRRRTFVERQADIKFRKINMLRFPHFAIQVQTMHIIEHLLDFHILRAVIPSEVNEDVLLIISFLFMLHRHTFSRRVNEALSLI